MEPETTTARQHDPWACILCGRRILSAFVWTPVICDRRGRPLYTARAHAACCDLAAAELTGPELDAARAALAASHDGLARLVASWQPAGQAVTP